MLCVGEIHSAIRSRVEQTHNIYHEPLRKIPIHIFLTNTASWYIIYLSDTWR